MSQPISTHQRQIFLLFLLAVIVAGKVVQTGFDNDTWWHLRVGQFIVAEHRFPQQEPFSRIGQEERTPWIAYSWLYELSLYGCFQIGGPIGIVVFRFAAAMLSWGGIAWFMFRHAWNSWHALLLLALVSISILPFSSERPWHFSIFFTTLSLHAVICVRAGVPWQRFFWLPLMYILWANLHIQFVMGFAVIGLAWFAALVDGYLRGELAARLACGGLLRLGLLCALVTLITPYHVRLYFVIWEYATQTMALARIPEAQPLDLNRLPKEWFNWPLVVLVIWAAVATFRRGFRVWDILFLASACFFSMRMQRDLWYGVLVSSAVVLHEREDGVPASTPVSGWTIGLICSAATVLIFAGWELGLSGGKSLDAKHEKSYPVEAVKYVQARRPAGPLFNDFDWGGFLIWALPDYPVGMDGRTNLYGEARLVRSFDSWAGLDWENDQDLLNAGVIIAPKKRYEADVALTEILRKQSTRWRIEYEDDTAVVFIPIR